MMIRKTALLFACAFALSALHAPFSLASSVLDLPMCKSKSKRKNMNGEIPHQFNGIYGSKNTDFRIEIREGKLVESRFLDAAIGDFEKKKRKRELCLEYEVKEKKNGKSELTFRVKAVSGAKIFKWKENSRIIIEYDPMTGYKVRTRESGSVRLFGAIPIVGYMEMDGNSVSHTFNPRGHREPSGVNDRDEKGTSGSEGDQETSQETSNDNEDEDSYSGRELRRKNAYHPY